MTRIKRLAPKTCPDCKANGTLVIGKDRLLTCRFCGYKDRNGTAKSSQAEPVEDRRKRWQINYGTPYTSQIDRWAESKFYSGLDYARQERWGDSIRAFQQAIDQQRDFVDAHLWIARFATDPELKRHHYEEVIAQAPMNLEATRELMVLNGDMTREEADRAEDMSSEQDIRDAEYAVATELVEIVCSNCGGSLEVPHGSRDVTCQFCGHVEAVKQNNGVGMRSLAMAMIKDRGQGIKWRVGEHLLYCDNCGAERVITSKKMTSECPFCGSDHVIKTDALRSFRQPDGIVPFQVNPKEADAALEGALNSFSERLKGFFINNKADRVQMTAAYLPFWVFDVTAQIIKTQHDKTGKRTLQEAQMATKREQFNDGLNNIPYSAVTSPPHRLIERLRDFDLDAAKPYDPKLLANFTAELYSIDYQQASLDVRGDITERFRFRHGHQPHGDHPVHVSSMVQQMSFRLLMLPVWIATIVEDDGDVRLGLVHGQTGQAVLGKASRPE